MRKENRDTANDDDDVFGYCNDDDIAPAVAGKKAGPRACAGAGAGAGRLRVVQEVFAWPSSPNMTAVATRTADGWHVAIKEGTGSFDLSIWKG